MRRGSLFILRNSSRNQKHEFLNSVIQARIREHLPYFSHKASTFWSLGLDNSPGSNAILDNVMESQAKIQLQIRTHTVSTMSM